MLPGGFAKVSVKDLRYVAAYRIMANDYRRNAVLEITSLRRAIDLQQEQIAEMEQREALKDARVRAIAERNAQLEQDLQRCAKKRDRLKPWADAGKVAVSALALVAGYTIYSATLAP